MSDTPTMCECCHYEGAELTEYQRHDDMPKAWLCELCASSLAGNMHQYPRVYPSDFRMLAGVVCNVGNHILAAIREKSNAK